MKSATHEMSRPDVILHLGAGNCSELETWLAASPRRIVLVEPNPDAAKRLTALARDDDRIHVVQQAVGDPDGSPRLRRFNIPALSSLREPTGLRELFPGLRMEREIDVDAVSPIDLFESFELDPDGHNWLIIDTPGEERAIVESLRMAEQLDRFGRIVLHCGARSLYEGNTPANGLLNQLQKAGYDIEQRDDSDPDRPCWWLRRNPLRLENQALRQQISDFEIETQELSQALDEQAKQAKELHQTLEALNQDKQGLKKRIAELEAENKELAESRDAARQAEQDASEKLNAEIRHSKEEAEARVKAEELEQERSRQLAERQQQLQRLQADEAEIQAREGQLDEEITRAEAQIDLIKDLLLHEERQ